MAGTGPNLNHKKILEILEKDDDSGDSEPDDDPDCSDYEDHCSTASEQEDEQFVVTSNALEANHPAERHRMINLFASDDSDSDYPVDDLECDLHMDMQQSGHTTVEIENLPSQSRSIDAGPEVRHSPQLLQDPLLQQQPDRMMFQEVFPPNSHDTELQTNGDNYDDIDHVRRRLDFERMPAQVSARNSSAPSINADTQRGYGSVDHREDVQQAPSGEGPTVPRVLDTTSSYSRVSTAPPERTNAAPLEGATTAPRRGGVSTAPRRRGVTATRGRGATAPRASVTTAPRTRVPTAPRASVTTAPRTRVTTAPRARVTTAPRARVTTAPRARSPNDIQDSVNNVAANDTLLGNGGYAAKDGITWGPEPPTAGRRRACNILREAGGYTRIPDTYGFTNPVDAVLLFLRHIIPLIVTYTNLHAKRLYEQREREEREQLEAGNRLNRKPWRPWKPCDSTEIEAFIGLVILAGTFRQSKHTYERLWNAFYGPAVFRATMSLVRFKQLLRHMRFDDPLTRPPNDKFAPIREVWEITNKYLGEYYVPTENLTVDEQLVAFMGRCGFKQYMPNKPARYGLKINWICDAKTFYPLKGIPYLGKEDNQRAATGLGSRLVIALCSPYMGSGRNITCDNYFTDLEMALFLLRNKLTLVGTVRQNKRFVPEEFKPDRERAEGSSLFGFRNDATLVSYVPKIGRAVILLSTFHLNDNIIASSNKPEIIHFYNETKGGVDTLDHLIQKYSCKRATRRWPMIMAYNLIDIICVAAFVIWIKKYPDWSRKKYRRRLFLESVGEGLVKKQIDRRYETCHHSSVRGAIRQVQPERQSPNHRVAGHGSPARGRLRCYVCPRKSDRKSKFYCAVCRRHICAEHCTIKRICNACNQQQDQ